jgi:NADH dehydrogenase/NADH:ubiquinone oxidoreductase subunit G
MVTVIPPMCEVCAKGGDCHREKCVYGTEKSTTRKEELKAKVREKLKAKRRADKPSAD